MKQIIYHLARQADLARAQEQGAYLGSDVDRADGFLHFSTAAQIKESAAKHRAGETGLVLLAVDADALGDTLRWEKSRGGALFPHVYGAVDLALIIRTAELPLDASGLHRFPEWL
jgi:uncharacterized protein (DUF952 family)